MSTALINPFAPQAAAGMNVMASGTYQDAAFDYVFNTTPPLVAGEFRPGIQKALHADADFVLRAIHYAQPNMPGVPFSFRWFDWQNIYHSDDLISNLNWSADPYDPALILPEVIFPRGSFIGLDLRNDDPANPNDIQIVFRGVKRFRIATSG